MLVGIGIDLVEHASLLEKDMEKLSLRLLSNRELDVYHKLCSSRKIEYLASRFACKEAIFKAFKNGDKTANYKDFSILNHEDGSPYVKCSTKASYEYLITLSHTKNYSVAYVMIYKS